MTIIGTIDKLLDREKWMEKALCPQVDGDMFFVDKGESTKPAKAVCAHCEVAAECLQYALDNDFRFGVFGGYSERERRRMKVPIRERKPADDGKSVGRKPRTARECPSCGSVVPVGNVKYCSMACAPKNTPTLSMPEFAKNKTSTCRTCGVDFMANHPRARYCTDECRRLAVNAQMRHRGRPA
ncbi:WhiB family transcriptional regulator [Mycolicibacterium sp.]|uniref:WhiB family transcriptional regulator n=1 Tax=Mycolicibacterium sp. TaxID=2320850 RepID=UPI0037C594CC